MDFIRYRNRAASQLPADTGVYVLCDLDGVPIYVGQSKDGIRARVRRHLTSARSDVIANRQLDVWEVAFVWAYPVAARRVLPGSGGKRVITSDEKLQIRLIESKLYHDHNSQSPLMNGAVVQALSDEQLNALDCPTPVRIQVMSDEEIAARKQPARRLPRQADHFRNLLDHMLNVKNEAKLRRALDAHGQRLIRYYKAFLEETRGKSDAKPKKKRRMD